MKTRSSLKPRLANAALAGALVVLATAAVAAQPLPKEGKISYKACYSGQSKFIRMSKTQVGFGYEFTGAAMADTPGTLFDHASFQCEGVGAIFGKERTGHAVCLFVDPDGDKDMARFTLRNGKWQRHDVAGTGKFDGIVIHVDLQSLGRFPRMRPEMFQQCNHVVGTYELK